MKFRLRLKLAWRILFHKNAHAMDHYDGHIDYFIGVKGESRKTLIVSTRTPEKVAKTKERRLANEQRIRHGATQLEGILGGKFDG